MIKIFTLSLLVLAVSINISASEPDDIRKILQKCIDLPELQKLYPESIQVYVLQHGISFSSGIDVTKFGKKVLFINKSQLESGNIKSYFLFWEFKIEHASANIDFVYNYPGKDNIPVTQRVILRLQKEGETWSVVKTEILEG